MKLFVVTLAIKFIFWLRFPKHLPTFKCHKVLFLDILGLSQPYFLPLNCRTLPPGSATYVVLECLKTVKKCEAVAAPSLQNLKEVGRWEGFFNLKVYPNNSMPVFFDNFCPLLGLGGQVSPSFPVAPQMM